MLETSESQERQRQKGPATKVQVQGYRSCWVPKSKNQRLLVVLKQVPKVQLELGPQIC